MWMGYAIVGTPGGGPFSYYASRSHSRSQRTQGVIAPHSDTQTCDVNE